MSTEKKFWVEKLAEEVREKFKVSLYRTENGVGASGIPHIGSISDAVRSYGVKLALEEFGLKAEHIAFSDDKDGLRKVPHGFPEELKNHIGKPVTSVPDPFRCHESYGDHMSSMLLDALDTFGIEYKFMSGTRVYKSGLLNPQIHAILVNAKKVGEIILEVTGQEKYTRVLPYLPVCANCGRIYTTEAVSYDPNTRSVEYVCVGGEIAGKWYEGCGFKGERKISEGEGKLVWKSEFAARWAALRINFEAYGKELTDSVATNDRICREVLRVEPPVHTRYELFLNKQGKKLSKSAGELITHTEWLKYGSPQSLLLLMFKRFEGAREVGLEDIPIYMNEYDVLEEIYFGKRRLEDKSELVDKISLYRYSNLLRIPPKPTLHPPYNLVVYLCRIAPKENTVEYVLNKLADYGYKPLDDYERNDLLKRINYAMNWARDFETISVEVTLDEEERALVKSVAQLLLEQTNEEGYQAVVYQVAKQKGVEPKRVFRALYKALLGQESGPRFSSYVSAMGKQNVVERLVKAAEDSKTTTSSSS